MEWLNEPIAIIEDDKSYTERLTQLTTPGGMQRYRRTITYITTRYVGCDYVGACAWRDKLQTQYATTWQQSIDCSVLAVVSGQYHVLATLKSVGDWTLES